MRLFITGFDAFGKHKINPSQEIVNLLPSYLNIQRKKILLNSFVLPSCCGQMWSNLKSEVVASGKGPLTLILTGYAAERDRICLERFALNIQDYRIPDNEGHQPQDRIINARAQTALTTKIPLLKLEKHLASNNFPCDISNYAGTYLCNDIYFRALNAWQKPSSRSAILFVHLPPPEKYAQTLAKYTSKKTKLRKERAGEVLEYMADAVEKIARFACLWLTQKN